MKERLLIRKRQATFYYNKNLDEYIDFCHVMEAMATSMLLPEQTPIFLCIGSDRITGDCLGPFVGHKLKKYFRKKAIIYGTLEHPIHAKNLEYTLSQIKRRYPNPFLIAVDAALGMEEHIGCVTLSNGSLSPGGGMRKKLPSVGDIAITGIVGNHQGDVAMHLQNTRLHLVNELSDFIFMGIVNAFSWYFSM